jgi:asparagine synthase (glutamine-hydrolysing)
MCGIAGCYQQSDGESLARVMNDRMAHRGPDACGIHSFVTGNVAVQLAHRRLSIIDLSKASDQPFAKGGLVLSYNGELYNFKEIKAELVRSGVRFETTSDTEVVLEAWRRWGWRALLRFRGMFAFALLDEATGKLVLARDQLGIKPLYFLRRGGGVLFASDL